MSEAITISEDLLTYGQATERQIEYAKAVNKHGGIKPAARALGVHHSSIQEQLKKLKAKASVRGYSPEHGWIHAVPPTHVAKGVSTMVRTPAGDPQWVKADLRQELYNEMVKEAIRESLKALPKLQVCMAPADFQHDIIPWVQIGDAHLGMLAHMAETTDNFDLKIAERELLAAMYQLIDDLPPCGRIVLNDLGDFTHYENMAGVTEASGHPLDYDGRFPKMIRAYVRIMRAATERALTRAAQVDWIVNQGNHSRTNDFWMAEYLRGVYGHTGRVNVLDNDNVFIPYRMGNTLVMVHHSDKCKPKDLVGVMTTDFRKDYGETEFHYIDTGHVHHHFVSKEHPGVVIESWNHLAANDKWAHEGGWRSRKSISVVFRSRRFGDLGRRHMPLEEVRERILRTTGIAGAARKEVYSV
jgi:hypothetical protein